MSREPVATFREPLAMPAAKRTFLGTLQLHVYVLPNGSVEIDQATRFAPAFKGAQEKLTDSEKLDLVDWRAKAANMAGEFFSRMLAYAASHGWRS